jgi:hypothetical protein
MTRRTRCAAFSFTVGEPLMTRETVALDTPARSATVRMFVAAFLVGGMSAHSKRNREQVDNVAGENYDSCVVNTYTKCAQIEDIELLQLSVNQVIGS